MNEESLNDDLYHPDFPDADEMRGYQGQRMPSPWGYDSFLKPGSAASAELRRLYDFHEAVPTLADVQRIFKLVMDELESCARDCDIELQESMFDFRAKIRWVFSLHQEVHKATMREFYAQLSTGISNGV